MIPSCSRSAGRHLTGMRNDRLDRKCLKRRQGPVAVVFDVEGASAAWQHGARAARSSLV